LSTPKRLNQKLAKKEQNTKTDMHEKSGKNTAQGMFIRMNTQTGNMLKGYCITGMPVTRNASGCRTSGLYRTVG